MSYIETEEYSEKTIIFLASVAYKNTKCSSDFILRNYVFRKDNYFLGKSSPGVLLARHLCLVPKTKCANHQYKNMTSEQ
jgi:hypothetical protein